MSKETLLKHCKDLEIVLTELQFDIDIKSIELAEEVIAVLAKKKLGQCTYI